MAKKKAAKSSTPKKTTKKKTAAKPAAKKAAKKAAPAKKKAAKKKTASAKRGTKRKTAAKTAKAGLKATVSTPKAGGEGAPSSSSMMLHEVSPGHLHPYVEQPVSQPYLDYGPVPPRDYGRDMLVALPIHPGLVFVYWELSGDGSRAARESGKSWVLRCHDESSGTNWDIPVDVGAEDYYVQVEPERRYRFELGLSEESGFRGVQGSAVVKTPRVRSRPMPERQDWAHVREDVGPSGLVRRRAMTVMLKPDGVFVKGLYTESPLELIGGYASSEGGVSSASGMPSSKRPSKP